LPGDPREQAQEVRVHQRLAPDQIGMQHAEVVALVDAARDLVVRDMILGVVVFGAARAVQATALGKSLTVIPLVLFDPPCPRRPRDVFRRRPGRPASWPHVVPTMLSRRSLRTDLWLVGVTAALAASPAIAFACPNCESARLVRAAVWAPSALENLLFIALPFAIVGAMAALVHRVGSPRQQRKEIRP
jgi:hypothetical protein